MQAARVSTFSAFINTVVMLSLLLILCAPLSSDCTPYINGHDPSLLVSSCRLLMAAAAASSIVYTNITEAVFPLLLQQMNKDPQVSHTSCNTAS